MQFHSPWAFLLLIVVAAALFLRRLVHKTGAVRFSEISHAAAAGQSMRQRFSTFPLVLRVAALVCLVIALARPQTGMEKARDISEGIAIQMVVDRSGSMGAEMTYQGTQMTRLDVVKKVFLEFAIGNGADLPGRADDLIGMIAYARYPDTVCPLTLAHDTLPVFVDNTKLVSQKPEDGTAIGDALALAAARLQTAETALKKQQKAVSGAYKIKSKIIILLTDGQNNTGKRTPLEAADLAAEWGIRVYAIAIGGGDAMVRTPLGVFQVPAGAGADAATLKAIAEKTGGVFREAQDADALSEVYKEIDRLEKSEIEATRYVDYKEGFLPFALLALALIAGEILLSCTVFRRLP
ncbi:MAG: VWA domain-containing protein [Desulfosalsimonadaceae bacterium]|nr:VWA domain-containing protein [Desulfosalsimonadaceae bacterium]